MRILVLFTIFISLSGCCARGFKSDFSQVMNVEKELFGSYHNSFKDFFKNESNLSSGGGALLKKEFAKEKFDVHGMVRDFESILCPSP
jgi:hypothetical protein